MELERLSEVRFSLRNLDITKNSLQDFRDIFIQLSHLKKYTFNARGSLKFEHQQAGVTEFHMDTPIVDDEEITRFIKTWKESPNISHLKITLENNSASSKAIEETRLYLAEQKNLLSFTMKWTTFPSFSKEIVEEFLKLLMTVKDLDYSIDLTTPVLAKFKRLFCMKRLSYVEFCTFNSEDVSDETYENFAQILKCTSNISKLKISQQVCMNMSMRALDHLRTALFELKGLSSLDANFHLHHEQFVDFKSLTEFLKAINHLSSYNITLFGDGSLVIKHSRDSSHFSLDTNTTRTHIKGFALLSDVIREKKDLKSLAYIQSKCSETTLAGFEEFSLLSKSCQILTPYKLTLDGKGKSPGDLKVLANC